MTKSGSQNSALVGSGEFQYEASDCWQQLPAGWELGEAVGVATDSQDRVFVFARCDHPVLVFNPDGSFVKAWGEGRFVRPHGIWIAPDDTVFLTDDLDHTIHRFTPDGELLMTMGVSGKPSDTGCRNSDYRTITQPGQPFNQPTNLAIAPSGELFVSDGYGNCCIHRFSPEGELLQTWGAPGDGPGQFHLPHGIFVDSQSRVFVADRENSRLQLFSPDGEFLEQWTHVARPCNVFIDKQDRVYVAELGWRVGIEDARPEETGGRVSILDRSGNLLARWGGGDDPYAAGDFIAPHDIWMDGRGDLYVAEVTVSAAVKRGLVTADCPSLQKFTRRQS